ncbi:ABC transporter ATP-binding protein [Paenibacillus daejeonensis]|uniref:ABC transporter ATP-binding protein n=1 Tax=Paenibacillus daejeonensis TaxID=135193 RepID=UPI00036174B0|nr:ABC transporter ATP-binding protein [Paenibacillus daejeonensis]
MPYGKYIRKYWKGFSLAIFFLMLEAAADLMMPTLLAMIIDRGVANRDMDEVLRLGGIMLIITAVGAIAASMRNVLAVLVSQRFGTELRSDLFRKIQSLSFQEMNRFERASLITRMTNDITIVQNFVGGLMRIFVKAPMLGIGALILAIRLNAGLAVVLGLVVPIVAVLVIISMRIGFKRYMKVQQSLDRINSAVREYLGGVRVVKAFNRFTHEVERFQKTNEEQRHVSVQAMLTMAIFNPLIMLTVNLAVVAILWVGGSWINNGNSSTQVGELVAFINYMTQILFALMMVSMVFNMFVRARAGTSRINEVFARTSGMGDQLGGGEQLGKEASGRIDFEQVDFSYPDTTGLPVLRGVSFTCLPGQTVSIIGSTGSGKSTLAQLIPRFYDASSGRVRMDGIDVSRIDPATLREQIAIVPQKTMLFSGSILDNIRWGREDATQAEVEEAARLAQAHDFIAALPEGYESRLGQRGVNLSGGQKQRIAIARALIRKPRILILDDCTSALDTTTESRIKEGLREYAQGMTCLMIAQRITSVMDADQIVVLDVGEVVGTGTHKTLLRDCEVYQEIYKSQIGKELDAYVQGISNG